MKVVDFVQFLKIQIQRNSDQIQKNSHTQYSLKQLVFNEPNKPNAEYILIASYEEIYLDYP